MYSPRGIRGITNASFLLYKAGRRSQMRLFVCFACCQELGQCILGAVLVHLTSMCLSLSSFEIKMTVTLPCGVANYVSSHKRFQSQFNYAGVTYLFVTSSILRSERERQRQRERDTEREICSSRQK